MIPTPSFFFVGRWVGGMEENIDDDDDDDFSGEKKPTTIP